MPGSGVGIGDIYASAPDSQERKTTTLLYIRAFRRFCYGFQ